jgi:DivIVA domain-containing protein
MDLNPHRVRSAEFKTVKRGLDADEVRRFLTEVADALETAQNQSTAMEARARAAVARLQELSDDASSQASSARSDESTATTAEQSETISRTLLLAQRTADTAIAQAEAESQRLVAAATEEAASTLDSTRDMAAGLMEEAREEARRLGESERLAVASEVDSLKARRDFLESDVDHLEQFLGAQRGRLREAANAMIDLTERVNAGLGEVHRPLLSAADNEASATATDDEPLASFVDDGAELSDVATDATPADTTPADEAALDDYDDQVDQVDNDDEGPLGAESEIFEDDEATDSAEPIQAGFALGEITGDHERPEGDDDVRFSFDDRS